MISQELISQIEACIASGTLTDEKRQEFVNKAVSQGCTASEVTLYMNTRQPQVAKKSVGVDSNYQKAKESFDSTLKDIQKNDSKQEKKKNTAVIAIIAILVVIGGGLSIYFWMAGQGIRNIDKQFATFSSQVESLPTPSIENYDVAKQQLGALPTWEVNKEYTDKEANYEQTKIAEYTDNLSDYAATLNTVFRSKYGVDDDELQPYIKGDAKFIAQENAFKDALDANLNEAISCLSKWTFKEEYVKYKEAVATSEIELVNKAFNAEIDAYNRKVSSIIDKAIFNNDFETAKKCINMYKANAFIISNTENNSNSDAKDLTFELKNTARTTTENKLAKQGIQ